LILLKFSVAILLSALSVSTYAGIITTKEIGDLSNYGGNDHSYAEIYERFDPSLGALQKVELRIEGSELKVWPSLEFYNDGFSISPTVGGSLKVETESYLNIEAYTDSPWSSPEVVFSRNIFDFGCVELTDSAGNGNCEIEDALSVSLGTVVVEFTNDLDAFVDDGSEYQPFQLWIRLGGYWTDIEITAIDGSIYSGPSSSILDPEFTYSAATISYYYSVSEPSAYFSLCVALLLMIYGQRTRARKIVPNRWWRNDWKIDREFVLKTDFF
jgi:hypothetical protein